MAYTSGDVAALQTAIATGARRVRFSDGREVEYRSLAELRETLRLVEAAVAGSTEPVSRAIIAGF